METLSHWYGKLLNGLALLACAILFLMTVMICADVLLRNVRLVPGVSGASGPRIFSRFSAAS